MTTPLICSNVIGTATIIRTEHMKKPKRLSRADRWNEAVAAVRATVGDVEAAVNAYNEALGELRGVQEEYQEWLDGLPEGGSEATREKLETVTDLDLTEMDEPDASVLDEAESIDLPLGFGRD